MRYNELIEDSDDDDMFGAAKKITSPEQSIHKWKMHFPANRRVHGSYAYEGRRLFDLSSQSDPKFQAGDSISRSAYWTVRVYTNPEKNISALEYEDSGGGTVTYFGARDKNTLADMFQMLYDTGMIENPEARRNRLAAKAQSRLDTIEKKGLRPGVRVRMYGDQEGVVKSVTPKGKIIVTIDGRDHLTTANAIAKRNIIGENDDDMFGGNQLKARNKLKHFDPDALPQLDLVTQRKVYQASQLVIRHIQDTDDWYDFEQEQPADAERVLYDFLNFGRYIQQNNPLAALAALERNAVSFDYDEEFLHKIRRLTGIDMHSLIDLEDPNQDQAWMHYASGAINEDDDDDNDMFGQPLHSRLAEWLKDYGYELINNPEDRTGVDEDDPDYAEDIADIQHQGKVFLQIAKMFAQRGMQTGAKALVQQSYKIGYEWFEDVMAEINDEFNIDIGDIALGDINETEHDDELFGQRWYERVNRRSIELDGIDRRDYPDFADAHVSYAELDDGTPLTDEQLDELTDRMYDSGELNQMAHDSLYESEDDDDLFATPTIAFYDVFNEHDEDQLQAMGFQYGDYPEQDIEILNDYLEGYKDYRVVGISGGEHDLTLHLDRSSRLGETEDDQVSDDDLFGVQKMYYVMIMANYNTGRYSDYTGRRYIVPGSSPEAAMRYLKSNEDLFLAYMDSQKSFNGKRIVRRPARDNVFLDNSSVVGEAPAGSNSAIERFIRKHRAVQ